MRFLSVHVQYYVLIICEYVINLSLMSSFLSSNFRICMCRRRRGVLSSWEELLSAKALPPSIQLNYRQSCLHFVSPYRLRETSRILSIPTITTHFFTLGNSVLEYVLFELWFSGLGELWYGVTFNCTSRSLSLNMTLYEFTESDLGK